MILAAITLTLPVATMTPVSLRLDSLTNPVGIDQKTPHFSWKLKANSHDSKNLKQTAYRIIVASSDEKLNQNTGDIWDSGKVSSDDTYAIDYKGKPLTSNQAASWKVQAWDQDGEATDWSSPATFTTGLFNKSDWKAKWITHKPEIQEVTKLEAANWIWTTGNPKESNVQKTFTLKSKPIDAMFVVSADDQFHAYLNNEHAANSDGRGDAWKRPQSIDATKYLKEGENQIRVIATNNGDAAGIVAKLTVTYADGSQESIVTDGTWLDDKDQPATVIGLHGVAPWGIVTEKVGRPSTLYRKDFTAGKPIKRATAFVTALGLIDLHLNGDRVTEDLFTPGWTDYNQRLYYRGFDVTDHLDQGINCIAAELGDGWYSGYIGWDVVRDHYGPQPQLLVQLEIEYQDGTKATVVSDDSWTAATGATIEQDFLMGEGWDARKHRADWSKPGYQGDNLAKVEIAEAPDTLLQNYPAEPVQAYDRLKPVSIKQSGEDKYIVDFGQNLAGFAKITYQGKPGQVVKLSFVEVLNEDGTAYRDNLRGARALDTFISDGNKHTWEPRFTFHGFRYIEVSGWGSEPKPEDIEAVAISSATPEVGSFNSSDPMLNQLASNAWWTQKMNFIDIPTDCPQRDERLGWTGDAQAYIRTAAFYSDVQAFFNKWLTTLDDAQEENGNFPKVAPVVMGQNDGGPAWADAGVICPWAIYEVYGDKRQLAEHYPAMKAFVDFTKNRSKPNLLPPDQFHCFGDWLQINANTPTQVIYTAYFSGSARIVSQAAEVLGYKEDAETYSKLADDVAAAFTKEYVDENGVVRGESQCGYVLALGFDLLPEDLAKKAADNLIKDIESRDWHLSTGFVGTRDLMHVLTKIGRNDVAFRLLHNKTFPSWLFPVSNGATTIWERWDGWTPENGFQSAGMNSFAHYAYGAVMQWVFENVGGIKLAEAGFDTIQIAPAIDPNLEYATTTYESIHGTIKTDWRKEDGYLYLTVTTPPNTQAKIQVPTPSGKAEAHTVGSGTHTYRVEWK